MAKAPPMSPTISSARVLTAPGPGLSRDSVDELARQISTTPAAVVSAIVIECHSVREVAPSGLSALLDLRADHPNIPFVLVSMAKPMLAAALEAGLAERFMICHS